MLNLSEFNNYALLTYLSSVNNIVEEFLDEKLKYYTSGYQHSHSYKTSKWDGRIKFFRKTRRGIVIPLGFIKDTLEYFGKDITYACKTRRPESWITIPENRLVALKKYQGDALQECLKNRMGIISAPTGSGKTEIMMHLFNALRVRTLIVVPTKDLVRQTTDRFRYAFPKNSITDDISDTADVSVITYSRLNRIVNGMNIPLDWVEMIILDEAHHANGEARSFFNAVQKVPAYYRYAFSATPFDRTSKTLWARDVGMLALFGSVIVDIPYDIPLNENVILPIKVLLCWINPQINLEDLPQDKTKAYREVKNRCISSQKRLEFINELKLLLSDKKALFMVNEIRSCEIIHAHTGIPYVHGEMKRSDRERIYYAFKNGEIQHLLSTPIFGEGLDVKDLDVIVLCEPLKGYIPTIQRSGRVSRKAEDKDFGLVIDIADTVSFLANQARRRKKHYQSIGYEVIEGNTFETKKTLTSLLRAGIN